MAEMPILTPKEGGEEEAQVIPETPQITPEGLEGEGTPNNTTPEGDGSTPKGGEEDTYKERYADSSREAKRLYEENRLLKTQIDGLSKKQTPAIELPSDEELSKSISEWDMMSPIEQKIYKEQIGLKKEISFLKGDLSKTSGQLEWENNFVEITKNDSYKELISKKSEFKYYCDKHAGTPIEVLAKSFLFEKAETLGGIKEKERQSRVGLEKGVGGIKTPQKPGLTYEEREKIRIEDPKRYAKLLKQGVIKE